MLFSVKEDGGNASKSMLLKGDGAPMIRIAKQSDPKRLSELKQKIDDEKYLAVAIKQIASTLTHEIVNINEEKT